MKTSVMISPDLLDDLGLLRVLEACQCRSPQGNNLKNTAHLYTNTSRGVLQEELNAIDRLLS